MKIAVCEDEIKQQDHVQELLAAWKKQTGSCLDVDFFTSGEPFLTSWQSGVRYDMVFLDIHMAGMDGMKTALRIRQLDEQLLIVFLTSRMEYVLKGYEVNAWRYLLKPVHPSEFFLCLNKAKELSDREQNYFVIFTNNRYIKVVYEDITYIESFGHYIEINTTEKSFQTRIGISQMEERLPEYFFRCHRSYLINTKRITELRDQQVLIGEKVLPLSGKRRQELIDKMNIK